MYKLSGKKRKIFKLIYSNCTRNNKITKSDLYKLSNIPKSEIDIILNGLYDENFFTYVGLYSYFYLTDKGLSYFSSETQDAIETGIKSILCPILVSFLTTLTTLLLKNLL